MDKLPDGFPDSEDDLNRLCPFRSRRLNHKLGVLGASRVRSDTIHGGEGIEGNRNPLAQSTNLI